MNSIIYKVNLILLTISHVYGCEQVNFSSRQIIHLTFEIEKPIKTYGQRLFYLKTGRRLRSMKDFPLLFATMHPASEKAVTRHSPCQIILAVTDQGHNIRTILSDGSRSNT